MVISNVSTIAFASISEIYFADSAGAAISFLSFKQTVRKTGFVTVLLLINIHQNPNNVNNIKMERILRSGFILYCDKAIFSPFQNTAH